MSGQVGQHGPDQPSLEKVIKTTKISVKTEGRYRSEK
jgi:hypothetical protein